MGNVAATAEKPTFDQSYPEIKRIVQSRKGSWTYISLMEWSDVSSIITTRIWKQWPLYQPTKGPLENWANTVITRALFNLRRDLALRYARPCVKSCVFNLGGDACEITPSRTQCDECPLYKDWNKTRRHQFNIKSTVALENHAQEVSNMPSESFDIEAVQTAVHKQMRANLTKWEYRVYHLLYVKHLKPAVVSEELQTLVKTWKRAPRPEELTYQYVLTKQRWFKELILMVLKREGYDLQAFTDYVQRTD